MIDLACRRNHYYLPGKLFICVLVLLAFCLSGCGEKIKHSEVDKNASLYSKSGFTIKKPSVCYPMQKVIVGLDTKLTNGDELALLVNGKKVDIIDTDEQSISFRAPFKVGHHKIILVKNGKPSNKSGFNVIAYH
jgi:hypothetical protein